MNKRTENKIEEYKKYYYLKNMCFSPEEFKKLATELLKETDHLIRGQINQKLIKYEESLFEFNEYIKKNPTCYKGYFFRALLTVKMVNCQGCLFRYLFKKRINYYKEAYNDLCKSIELNPNHYMSYYERGYLVDISWRYGLFSINLLINPILLVLNDYSKALELAPDCFFIYFTRGEQYERQNKYNLALKDYKSAIKIYPDFVLCYERRIQIYKRINRYDLVLKDYNKLIELKPSKFKYMLRGNLYKNIFKNHVKAIKDYSKAGIYCDGCVEDLKCKIFGKNLEKF